MPQNSQNISERMKSAVKRDPQKATILGVLLIVLGAVIVKTVLPQTATPLAAKASTVSSETKTQIVETAKQRARTLSAGDDLERFLAAPVKPITRNLFAVKLEYFPADATASRQDTGTAEIGKNDDPAAKSLRDLADQQSRKEVLIANLRQQAMQLKLQSTVMGPTPQAVINGELLGVGDVIASFRVLKIEARKIIVEREGIKLEITMK